MLQFITHTNSRFGYINGAEETLKGGCRWIQLRMKDSSRDEIVATAHQLRELCNSYGAKFIIDDYVDIVKEVGADGVHLGKGDMSPDLAREVLGVDYIIGGTANSFEDIEILIAKGVDYIGLGPFRFTTTKKNLSSVLGLKGYVDIAQKCRNAGYNTPFVAIGGIICEDIESILAAGVTGIALSGAILNAENPYNETSKIMKIIDKL